MSDGRLPEVGSLLLVHSPLVGPSTWSRLAAMAVGFGLETVVPDLTGFADSPRPRWAALVDMAVSAAADLDQIVVVGHSGAGAVLPVIGDRLRDRASCLVFVDAIHPSASGRHETKPELAELLDTKTTDGRLAPWLDWWPSAVIESLLPSTADRVAIASDTPTLPRDTYDDPIAMPEGWTDRRAAYLQLSEAYADERARAARLGWPTRVLDSTHLGVVTEPERTLRAVLDLVAELQGRR